MPKGSILELKSITDLQFANEFIVVAAYQLGRILPSSMFSRKYLQRDYWIIQAAQAVVAIGYVDEEKIEGVGVEGGTGYTCQMYCDLALKRGDEIRMWVFDMKTNQWMRFCKVRGWELSAAPKFERGGGIDRIALIGSREITKRGIDAIHECF